jgi:hypothetical protein
MVVDTAAHVQTVETSPQQKSLWTAPHSLHNRLENSKRVSHSPHNHGDFIFLKEPWGNSFPKPLGKHNFKEASKATLFTTPLNFT